MSNATSGWYCEEHLATFHPTSYLLWAIVMFLLFLGTLIFGVAGLYLRRCHPLYMPRKINRNSSVSFARTLLVDSVKPINSFGVIYFSVCRLLWLLNPHPFSVTFGGKLWANADSEIPERPIISVFLYTPQVVILLSLTLLVTLWRRVTNNAQKIRRQVKSIRKETTVVLVCAFYLTFLALPIALISSWVPSLVLLSNGLFGIYVLGTCSLAFTYIWQLSNIVKTLSNKSKHAVLYIERTVQVLVVSCFMLVFAILYNMMVLDRCQLSFSSDMNSSMLFYIWMVHAGEAIGVSAICFAIFPIRRKAKRRSTPSGARISQMSKSEYDRNMARKSTMESTTEVDLEADTCDTSVHDEDGQTPKRRTSRRTSYAPAPEVSTAVYVAEQPEPVIDNDTDAVNTDAVNADAVNADAVNADAVEDTAATTVAQP